LATVSTPYATGTITSISGTTVNLSGGAVAGWVGRCIRIRSGSAKGQIRKIVTFVSATQITVDYAWSISPFSGFGFTEVEPVNGDSFVISHFISDFADGTTVISDPGNTSFRFVGASSFSNGVFIYAANARVDLASSSITGNQATELARVCWRFGDIDQYGNVYNGCSLLDTAGAPSGFGTGTSTAFDPDFHYYAGTIRCTGAGPFWRFHSDAAVIVRIIGSYVDGNLGGRMMGTNSIFKDWVVYNMASASGPFNPKAPFGLITNIKVAKSLQALYQYWPDSLTVEAEGIKPDITTTKLVRFANSSISGQMLTVKDLNIPVISTMPLLYSNSSGSYSNTFRIAQYLNSSYVNVAGNNITELNRTVIKDITATTVYNNTNTTGVIPKQTLRYRDMTVLNTGDYTWASAGGTTFAPYTISSIAYNYTPAISNLSLQTSQTVSLIGFADTNISQTNKATVDAYSSIADLDQLYDRAKSWTCDNLELAIPSFGSQIINANGTELNLGALNLVVDSGAVSAITVTASTITIKATALLTGTKFKTLKTTGTITFTGSTFNGNYTDATGSYVAITINGLLNGTRVQVYNMTNSIEIDNFVYSGSYKKTVAYTTDKTIRVRATYCSGLVAMKETDSTGILTSSGVSFLMSQTNDDVYISNALNGSTITEFSGDYPNVQIDIADPDGVTSIQRLYAWYRYNLTTAEGIRNYYAGLEASDSANYTIFTAIVNLLLDNTSAIPVKIVGGYLSRDDGSTVIAASSGSIQLDPGKAYIANSTAISTSLNKIQSNCNLIPALL